MSNLNSVELKTLVPAKNLFTIFWTRARQGATPVTASGWSKRRGSGVYEL
ncbi:hypothetical protein F3I62_10010 [Pseudomonas sp. R-28-1W-6]|nr:hypothetical protein [Pseudomonas sp. R-28-1W-6]MWV12429.1 hypothetical protein [Pseudomonas sp. R-28-1W-6]